MSQQDKSRLGAIGEHMVTAQLVMHDCCVFNANASMNNMPAFDLICVDKNCRTALVQVKTTVEKSFPVGFSLKVAENMQEIEKRIVGPWVFVKMNQEGAEPHFDYYILSRSEVIDLIWESNNWYMHKVDRGGKTLNDSAVCAIMLEWLNGKDYTAPRSKAETFINPLKGVSAKDRWDKIWSETGPCPYNTIECPCTKEGCPRHGKCCECVAHHKAHGTKLPACLRGIEWQK